MSAIYSIRNTCNMTCEMMCDMYDITNICAVTHRWSGIGS
jgi:hypothetical protein